MVGNLVDWIENSGLDRFMLHAPVNYTATLQIQDTQINFGFSKYQFTVSFTH